MKYGQKKNESKFLIGFVTQTEHQNILAVAIGI